MADTPASDAPLGLSRHGVTLVPYDPRWPALFEQERAQLLAATGEDVLDIQHVGSTALPGVPAKPILDIAIAVENWEGAEACIGPVCALGYEYRGEHGVPRRRYFCKGTPERRTHHIHMVEAAGDDWLTLALFRDYLLAHPEAAAEYGSLKRALAAAHPDDRGVYQDGKAPFIRRTIESARRDAGLSQPSP